MAVWLWGAESTVAAREGQTQVGGQCWLSGGAAPAAFGSLVQTFHPPTSLTNTQPRRINCGKDFSTLPASLQQEQGGTRTLKLCLSELDCAITAGTCQGFFVPPPCFPLSLHDFLYFRWRILSLGMLDVSQTWHPGVWSTAAGAGCGVPVLGASAGCQGQGHATGSARRAAGMPHP